MRRADQESSRRVLAFEALTRMHRATREGAADRPRPARSPPPACGRTRRTPSARARVAARARADGGIRTDRVARAAQQLRPVRGPPPDHPGTVGGLLAAARTGARLDTDVTGTTDGGLEPVRLYVFVNHVDGLAPGAYAYDPAAHALHPVIEGPPGELLQRAYFLANYNLEQAAVVVVPAVRTTAVLDAVGDRGTGW
ncbi:hypothetical protein NKH77_02640 [Streptomyces sp. M19]